MTPPRDLTIPEPGSTTARDILSQCIGALLRDLAAVPAAQGILRAAPRGAVASALRRPTVSGLLRCWKSGVGGAREDLEAELVAQLAFDLAVSRALPAPIRLQRWPKRLLSIAGRVGVRIPEGARGVSLEPGRVTVDERTIEIGDATNERPYARIDGELVLALADNNPLALVEAHPDKHGNAIDLGGHGADEWTRELAAAMAPIRRYMPDLAREIDLYVSQIVPVGYDDKTHLSASYQEIIGTVYMTLHPSRMTLTEAILHEASHNKLNALFELDDVLENAWSPLYASPVRPDPRPLHGVLLAVHAFLPVARLYELMTGAGDPAAQRDDFKARYRDIRRINREGADLVLREANPTAIGRGLLDEIRRWHEHYDRVDKA